MKEVYPDLRNARTEVITVIEKKPNNEILAIAQNIVSGEASSEDAADDKAKFPHSGTYKTKFSFVKSGEPPADPDA